MGILIAEIQRRGRTFRGLVLMDVMQRNIKTLRRLRRRNVVKVHPLADIKGKDDGLHQTNEVVWILCDELIELIREVHDLRQRVRMLERR